jgi:flagellar basal body-associated protein FliL
MIAVHNLLESTSAEAFKKRRNVTRVIMSLLAIVQVSSTLVAGTVFMYRSLGGNDKACDELDDPNVTRTPRQLTLFSLNIAFMVSELIVLALFLRYLIYFARKRLERLREAGEKASSKKLLIWVTLVVLMYLA